MFVLARLEDTIAVHAYEMSEKLAEVLMRRLNERLSNRVVPGLGLCLFVYDVLHVGDTFILPGDSRAHCKCKFRMAVFRPWTNQVMEARVTNSDRAGIHLSIGFFDDILIPMSRLPDRSVYDEKDKMWYWEYRADEDEETPAAPAKLYMDRGKLVRFRVTDVVFRDVKPDVDATGSSQESSDVPKERSMEVLGAMNDTGLGCIGWWATSATADNDEQYEEAEDEDEDEGEEGDGEALEEE